MFIDPVYGAGVGGVGESLGVEVIVGVFDGAAVVEVALAEEVVLVGVGPVGVTVNVAPPVLMTTVMVVPKYCPWSSCKRQMLVSVPALLGACKAMLMSDS
jgi:hypothetical protein